MKPFLSSDVQTGLIKGSPLYVFCGSASFNFSVATLCLCIFSWPAFCIYLCRRWSSTRWMVIPSLATWYTTSLNSMWVALLFWNVLSCWPTAWKYLPDQDITLYKQAPWMRNTLWSPRCTPSPFLSFLCSVNKDLYQFLKNLKFYCVTVKQQFDIKPNEDVGCMSAERIDVKWDWNKIFSRSRQ